MLCRLVLMLMLLAGLVVALPVAAPAALGPVSLALAFDDWIAEIWNPPD